MAQTPASSATTYCTAAVALSLFDTAFLGGLMLDDGTQASAADLADTGTTAGARFNTLLKAASGELEASCLRGQRYTAADLAALTGVGATHRDEIVATLAVGKAMWRRDPSKGMPDVLKWARERLMALESGAEIFGFTETEAAGSGLDVVRPPDAQPGPRPALSETAGRYFGSRSRTYTSGGQRFPRGSW